MGKPGFFDLNFISRIPRAILGPIFSLLAMLYLSRFFLDYSLSRRWLSACIALTLLVAVDFAIAWYDEYPASFERRMQTTVMHIPQVIAFGLVVPRLGTCNTMRRTSDSQLTAEALTLGIQPTERIHVGLKLTWLGRRVRAVGASHRRASGMDAAILGRPRPSNARSIYWHW